MVIMAVRTLFGRSHQVQSAIRALRHHEGFNRCTPEKGDACARVEHIVKHGKIANFGATRMHESGACLTEDAAQTPE